MKALPYVAFVNNDAVLEPGYLAACVAALEADPGLSAVQGVVLDAGGRLVDGLGIGWNRRREAVQLGHGAPPPSAGRAAFPVAGVSGTAPVFRRTDFERAGGFAGSFFAWYEDADLSLRLLRAGGRFACVPSARARHVGSATGRRTPELKWRLLLPEPRPDAAAQPLRPGAPPDAPASTRCRSRPSGTPSSTLGLPRALGRWPGPPWDAARRPRGGPGRAPGPPAPAEASRVSADLVPREGRRRLLELGRARRPGRRVGSRSRPGRRRRQRLDGRLGVRGRDGPGPSSCGSRENRGFGPACNLGAGEVAGLPPAETLLFLNPDAALVDGPAALAALLAELDADPGVARRRPRARGGRTGTVPAPAPPVARLARPGGLPREPPLPRGTGGSSASATSTGTGASRSTWSSPRPPRSSSGASVFAEVGGFDPAFAPAWFEDVDLCAKILESGYRIRFVPAARASHVGGTTMRALPYDDYLPLYTRNLLRYLRRHAGLPVRAGARAVLAAGALLRLALLPVRPGRPRPPRGRARLPPRPEGPPRLRLQERAPAGEGLSGARPRLPRHAQRVPRHRAPPAHPLRPDVPGLRARRRRQPVRGRHPRVPRRGEEARAGADGDRRLAREPRLHRRPQRRDRQGRRAGGRVGPRPERRRGPRPRLPRDAPAPTRTAPGASGSAP